MNHRFPIPVSCTRGYIPVSRLNIVLGLTAALMVGFTTGVLAVGLIVTAQ